MTVLWVLILSRKALYKDQSIDHLASCSTHRSKATQSLNTSAALLSCSASLRNTRGIYQSPSVVCQRSAWCISLTPKRRKQYHQIIFWNVPLMRHWLNFCLSDGSFLQTFSKWLASVSACLYCGSAAQNQGKRGSAEHRVYTVCFLCGCLGVCEGKDTAVTDQSNINTEQWMMLKDLLQTLSFRVSLLLLHVDTKRIKASAQFSPCLIELCPLQLNYGYLKNTVISFAVEWKWFSWPSSLMLSGNYAKICLC